MPAIGGKRGLDACTQQVTQYNRGPRPKWQKSNSSSILISSAVGSAKTGVGLSSRHSKTTLVHRRRNRVACKSGARVNHVPLLEQEAGWSDTRSLQRSAISVPRRLFPVQVSLSTRPLVIVRLRKMLPLKTFSPSLSMTNRYLHFISSRVFTRPI